jgi:hypothetical protein
MATLQVGIAIRRCSEEAGCRLVHEVTRKGDGLPDPAYRRDLRPRRFTAI